MILPDISETNGAYVLGLIWGCGTRSGDQFIFRDVDIEPLKEIRNGLGLTNHIFILSDRTHTLKVSRKTDVNRLLDWLDSLGWSRRQAQIREYPIANHLDDEGFIAGWVALHSDVDMVKVHRPAGAHKLRVRIYGNEYLLRAMTEQIAAYTGLSVMTLQKTTNEITKAIYYQGTSAEKLCEWLGIKRSD